uniref:Serine/threonine protein kinase n=1 Tax=Pithovirus LCDPAC02 TaxID=2506601 RepID=A0A481YND4_9VIRU|nr:MAG: serine/threonine protein kinase [Pithovirus LCDPAC02]
MITNTLSVINVLEYNIKYIQKIENIYDRYNFNIKDILLCDTDKKFMEMLGYYIYKAFENKNIKNILKYEKQEISRDPNLILTHLLFKENKYIKYQNKIKLFIKEYVIYDERTYERVLNEYYIGLKLNKLRDKIPNFVFLYSIITSKDVISFANIDGYYKDNHKHILLLMENLQGRKLRIFLNEESNDIPNIINIFLQIVLALNSVNQYYNFLHDDLHFNNIIIQNLNKERVITYKVKMNGKIVNINLRIEYLVKIFDFNKSRIGKKSVHVPMLNDIYYLFNNKYTNFKMYLPEEFRTSINKLMLDTYDIFLYKLLYESNINEYLDFTNIKYTKFNCDEYLIKDKDIKLKKGKLLNIEDIIKNYFDDLHNDIIENGNVDLKHYENISLLIHSDIKRIKCYFHDSSLNKKIKDMFKHFSKKYIEFVKNKIIYFFV